MIIREATGANIMTVCLSAPSVPKWPPQPKTGNRKSKMEKIMLRRVKKSTWKEEGELPWDWGEVEGAHYTK